MCVMIMWSSSLIWNLFAHFSLLVSSLLLPLTVGLHERLVDVYFVLLRKVGTLPPQMVPPKTSMESKGARQSCSAFTDAAVYLYAHAYTLAYTHSHMFLPIDHYQLFFPSGPGKVARSLRCSEAGISTEVSQTHAHTNTYTANLV